MGEMMTTEKPDSELKPGEFRVREIGDITTSGGDVIRGAIVEFPAGPPTGMTWADVWDGKAFQISASPVPPSEPVGWRPIESAPKKGRKVLVSVPSGTKRPPITMMARYWPKHTLPAPDGFGEGDGFDVDEHGDIYCPAGWYEDMAAEEPPLHNIEPTHWMPLPAAPGSAVPPSPRDEAEKCR